MAAKAIRMRAKALGYGVVLALVIASITLQVSFEATDATRFATIVLQAATLVAAVRTADVRGGTSSRPWRPSRP